MDYGSGSWNGRPALCAHSKGAANKQLAPSRRKARAATVPEALLAPKCTKCRLAVGLRLEQLNRLALPDTLAVAKWRAEDREK